MRCKGLFDYQDTSDQSVRMMPVKILASDPFHDLAVLTAELDVKANIPIGGTDSAPVGTPVSSFGFPHKDHRRLVLTQQDAEIGHEFLSSQAASKPSTWC